MGNSSAISVFAFLLIGPGCGYIGVDRLIPGTDSETIVQTTETSSSPADTDNGIDTGADSQRGTDTGIDTETDQPSDTDTGTGMEFDTGTNNDAGTIPDTGTLLDTELVSDTETVLDTETTSDTEVLLPSTCDEFPASAIFTFDTAPPDWELASKVVFPMSLTWETSAGVPAASGVAGVYAEPVTDEAVYFRQVIPMTDLSDAILSMRVWVSSGGNVHMKLYMQSGDAYAWADSGRYTPIPEIWSCIGLDISAADYQDDTFDAAQVITIGVEIYGDSPFTVYIDEARY